MPEDPKVTPRKSKALQDWFTYEYYRRPNMPGGTTPGITPPRILPATVPQPNLPANTPVVGSTGYRVPVETPPVTMPRSGGIAADTFVPGSAEGAQVNLPRSTTFDFPQFNFTPTASYQASGDGEGSGTQETRGGSGNEEIRGGSGDSPLTDPRLAPNIRPAVDALNYLLELNSINKIEKKQLGRKNMYFNTPSMSVRPIQDLSPEILAAQENSQNQIRSDYNGSDPVMNLIAKNMATAKRSQVRSENIAGRAAGLASERARWDTQMRENQKLAADTADKNLERAQDFADYKLGAQTAAEEARKTLNASFLSQVGLNIDTAAQYNLEREAILEQQKRQEFEDKLAMIGLLPEGERSTELADLEKTYAQYASPPLRDHNAARRLWRITRSQKTAEQNRKAKGIK